MVDFICSPRYLQGAGLFSVRLKVTMNYELALGFRRQLPPANIFGGPVTWGPLQGHTRTIFRISCENRDRTEAMSIQQKLNKRQGEGSSSLHLFTEKRLCRPLFFGFARYKPSRFLAPLAPGRSLLQSDHRLSGGYGG